MGDLGSQNVLTDLIRQAQNGNSAAEQQLFEAVNDELRQLAEYQTRRFGAQGMDQPTSLVNELFLKLFREDAFVDLKNRRYFFAVAIDQMRQILRNRFRHRKTQKRGGHLNRVPLDVALDDYLDELQNMYQFDFEALDEALNRLKHGTTSQRQYEVVNLRFLAGMTVKQTAELIGISERQVAIDWKLARAKLYTELKGRVL